MRTFVYTASAAAGSAATLPLPSTSNASGEDTEVRVNDLISLAGTFKQG